jgi:ABC-type proline/glycine betaine transport system permease subunit
MLIEMKTHAICSSMVTVIGLGILAAQSPAVGTVVTLDPALDQIVSANAKVDMLKRQRPNVHRHER